MLRTIVALTLGVLTFGCHSFVAPGLTEISGRWATGPVVSNQWTLLRELHVEPTGEVEVRLALRNSALATIDEFTLFGRIEITGDRFTVRPDSQFVRRRTFSGEPLERPVGNVAWWATQSVQFERLDRTMLVRYMTFEADCPELTTDEYRLVNCVSNRTQEVMSSCW
jgi:hypothetical protein